MGLIELFIIAVGLSMDAFAIAVGFGLTMFRTSQRKAILIGLYFGGFQALMPLIGFFTATFFAEYVTAYSHWIAFGVLIILGGKMILSGFKKDDSVEMQEESPITPRQMIPLSIATSIDALAVGVSFAFLNVKIIPAVSFIGVVTFIFSIIGVKIGNIFGEKFKYKAVIIGGVILVLMGTKILIDGVLA